MIQTNGNATLIKSFPSFDLYEVEVKGRKYRTCDNKIKYTEQPIPEKQTTMSLNHIPYKGHNATMVECDGEEITLREACEKKGLPHKKMARLMRDFNLTFAQAIAKDHEESNKNYLTITAIRRKYQIHQRVFYRMQSAGLKGEVYGTKNSERWEEKALLKWAEDNGFIQYFK